MPSAAYTLRSVPISICPRTQYVGESTFERVVFAAFIMSLTWGTALTCIGGSRLVFAGKAFCGYVWVIQGVLAALALAICKRGQISFPLWVWLPWLTWIAVRCDFGSFWTTQRTIMLCAGPIVGTAASVVIRTRKDLEWLIGTFHVIVPFSAAVFLIGQFKMLPPGFWYSGAASVMTLCLAASYYAPYVYEGHWKAILLWLCCGAICALGTARTATAVCLLTLPLSPTPRPFRQRLLATITIALLAVVAFSLPSMKQKILQFSDYDSLTEVIKDPESVYSSGRSYLWKLYWDEAWKKPIFGTGGNSSMYFAAYMLGDDTVWHHPHNDYIRVFFEYGAIGLLFLGTSMAYTLVYTYRAIRATDCRTLRDAWTVCFGGFISMCLLAITDNVILYIAFFGCLLFGILGAAHSVSAAEKRAIQPNHTVLRTRITHA